LFSMTVYTNISSNKKHKVQAISVEITKVKSAQIMSQNTIKHSVFN